MQLAKEILSHVKRLPESSQAEVLDFVKFLELKSEKDNGDQEWANISISNAMHGMEDEPSLYSINDIKEKVL
ncbi:DUF2281 domain-containing protein [Candidatus Thiosymbion oneisti]|uniref:DUF2281 domain-containing protein n=1 Tax=Candidatus Thiosymbion oneisti TaxID=589554 RepID=UPI0010614773|nr:DUF2281 domain-containing protein [Candidatus Thiosymbion oneisti]